MSLPRRDSLFILVAVIILFILALGTLKGKGRDTPHDEMHAAGYAAAREGKSQSAIERSCNECHFIKTIKGHPPKEQCLICHKLTER